MRFPDYRPFDAAFRDKYRVLLEGYPFAAMVVEKEARNFEADDYESMLENCRKLAPRKRGKAALLALAQILGPAKGPGYYQKMDGFGRLSADLAAGFGALGLESFSAQKLLTFRRNKHLHGLSVRGDAFPRFMQAVLDRGMEAAARDEALLAPLDREVRRNYEDVKRLIRRSDIRVMISDGDCMYFSRVMLHAAGELGIPFVVVSHGYVQNPYLATIAPIYADMFVAWTEDQVVGLAEAVGPGEASKIRYFGFPRMPALKSRIVPGRVLVVWDPLLLKATGVDEEIADLRRLFARLSDGGLSPRLRLHPKDRGSAALVGRLETAGLTIDRDDLGTALGEAAVVIGSYSSLLVEAAAVGRPVFQLAEYARVSLENLPQLPLADPDIAARIAAEAGRAGEPYPPFDVPAFIRAVETLMREKTPR